MSFGRAGKCSGTLIAPELVMTAGHRVLRRDRRGPVGPKGVAFRTGAYQGYAASSRIQRTEMAIAAKADRLVGVLKAVMGGF